MSTRGSVVSCAATSLDRGVTTLNTPARDIGVLGDEAAELAGHPRGVRRRLEDDGAARGQRGADLGEVDLVRDVPGRDRGDDADRPHAGRPPARDAHRPRDAEIGLPLVGLEQVGDPLQALDRDVEPAAPIMNPGMPTSAVVRARNSSALSSSAWWSWRRQRTRSSHVGRPVGLVEGPASGRDRGVRRRRRCCPAPGRSPRRWPG